MMILLFLTCCEHLEIQISRTRSVLRVPAYETKVDWAIAKPKDPPQGADDPKPRRRAGLRCSKNRVPKCTLKMCTVLLPTRTSVLRHPRVSRPPALMS